MVEYRGRAHDCGGRRRRLESSRNCGGIRDFMGLKYWYSCRVAVGFGGAEFGLCLKQPISVHRLAQILLFSNSNTFHLRL